MTDVALPEITYRLDTTALTVIAIDQHGQESDLNAEGEPCEADLAAASKRAVELAQGPLADDLAAEKADEAAVCPECHGGGRLYEWPADSGGEHMVGRELLAYQRYRAQPWTPCSRCKGSGQIDPFDFGVPTAQVARGRNAS